MAAKAKTAKKTTKGESAAAPGERAGSAEIISRPYEPSSKSYLKIAFGFVVATLILMTLTVYFVFYGATIKIKPQKSSVSAEAIYEVKENPMSVNAVRGKVLVLEEEKSGNFTLEGEKTKIDASAHGEVIIRNQSDRSQKLVATTRFLSDKGALFRIREGITVPAGGSAVAEIYADKKGEAGNIGPAHFTLPGLSPALQQKIFADSKAPMSGGIVEAGVITKEMLAKAREGLASELGALLRKKITESLAKDEAVDIAFLDEIVKQESSRAEGEGAENFDFKIRLRVIGVSWGKDLISRAAEILETLYPFGKELIASNLGGLRPQIEKYSESEGTAMIKITVQGTVIPTLGYELLDAGHFAGLNKAEIEKYLSDKKLAESAEIKFFPFWLKTAPINPGHIQVTIQK